MTDFLNAEMIEICSEILYFCLVIYYVWLYKIDHEKLK